MVRAIVFFTLSAILSVITFYYKPEHSLGYAWIVPVGLYFLGAFFLAVRPPADGRSRLQFAGLALLTWLVLFSVSYNLLFFVLAPISGAVGAWAVCWLAQRYLELSGLNVKPVVITGLVAAVLGVLMMIAMRELPKDTYTIGLKAGLIVGFWQLGVGVQMKRMQKKLQNASL